jgi:tetratricopeptide (TPR) repeat protein
LNLSELHRRLNASSGYAELELFQEAVDELEGISPELQDSVPVLNSWLDLYQHWKKFDEAYNIAQRLIEKEPNEPNWQIALAYSARRSRGILVAKEILEEALVKHPGFAMIHYNLACYTAQLGKLDHAQSYLDQAKAIDPKFSKIAETDPDLTPLRNSKSFH